jgi:hypothetical protein
VKFTPPEIKPDQEVPDDDPPPPQEEMKDKEVPSNYARKSAGRFGEDDSDVPF